MSPWIEPPDTRPGGHSEADPGAACGDAHHRPAAMVYRLNFHQSHIRRIMSYRKDSITHALELDTTRLAELRL